MRISWRLLVPLAALAVVVAACATGARPTWTFSPLTAGLGSPGPAGSVAPGQAIGTVAIEAFDLGFKPSTVEVAQAGTYTVEFKNTGALLHDITFADGTKLQATAGQTARGEVVIPAGGLAICSVPGHAGGHDGRRRRREPRPSMTPAATAVQPRRSPPRTRTPRCRSPTTRPRRSCSRARATTSPSRSKRR
jgi:plastocyanin